MKIESLRRMTAAASAAAIFLSAASCGKDKEGREAPTADKVLNNSYRSEPIDVDLDIDNVDDMVYIPDSQQLLISGTTYDEDTYEAENVFYLTDTAFTDVKSVKLDVDKPENGMVNLRTAYMPGGNIAAVLNIQDYGDMKAPDWKDPDFDYDSFDYEAFEEGIKYSYKVCVYDLDGNEISSSDLDLSEYAEENGSAYFNNMIAIDSETFVLGISGMEEHYISLNSSGEILSEIKAEGMEWIDSMTIAADGSLAVTGYGDSGLELQFLNTDGSGSAADIVDLKDFNSGMVRLLPGSGDSDVFISSSMGLYSIKDGESSELVNYMNSDINGQTVNCIIPVDNGDFIVCENDWSTGSISFSRLTARDMEELKDTKVITIALMFPGSDITEKITAYNKSATGYRFKVEDYSNYYDYDEELDQLTNTPGDQFKKDLISGKTPDMVILDDRSTLALLGKKGVFADLGEMLDNDSELKKDDIMPCVLKAGEINGKLVGLANSFDVETYVIKKKFYDGQGWSLDDMIEVYDNKPEGAKLYQYETKSNILYELIYTANKFIDYENGTCSFDDPEFVKFLEFCNRFPDEEEEEDFENFTDEDWENYSKEAQTAYRNDKALVESMYISDLRRYASLRYGEFGEEISLAGVPTTEGNGGVISCYSYMAIMDDSPCKDECWKFIKTFFTEEAQQNQTLPALVSEFDKRVDECTERPYWTDENGKKEYYDDSYWIGEEEIKIPPLTDEERDMLVDYVKGAETVSGGYSAEVFKIIDEETKAYFAGEKTAQEAADMIQSRVSIYVSEQS
ncbi:MAG: extracellular solute-binding protein [Ruminococcus sp.]|nr:extracellular solute-binding protein [Ruminococcus sp.]